MGGGHQDGDPPKKTTRAIKRAKAKARKQQQFKQLQAIAKGKGKQKPGTKPGGAQKEGGGKQQKEQVCFSYGRRRDGACCKLALGNEECPQGRLHECEFCHKKDHFSKDCPQKPARIKDW